MYRSGPCRGSPPPQTNWWPCSIIPVIVLVIVPFRHTCSPMPVSIKNVSWNRDRIRSMERIPDLLVSFLFFFLPLSSFLICHTTPRRGGSYLLCGVMKHRVIVALGWSSPQISIYVAPSLIVITRKGRRWWMDWIFFFLSVRCLSVGFTSVWSSGSLKMFGKYAVVLLSWLRRIRYFN